MAGFLFSKAFDIFIFMTYNMLALREFPVWALEPIKRA